jgi:hypothetical protein
MVPIDMVPYAFIVLTGETGTIDRNRTLLLVSVVNLCQGIQTAM